jgi:MerR family transcriptional regulator, light-induced transcriptional regulator
MNDLARRFLNAQLAGDRREGLRIIVEDGLAKGVDVARLHLDVIAPAQREIGRLWELNQATIAQEHVATGIASLALAALYPHLHRESDNGKRVFVACVEGEYHELGARIAADFLEMAGFDVRLVGANTPTRDLVEMTRRERPDLVALSVTMPFNFPAVRKSIAALREAMGADFPIAVGGPAFTWEPEIAAQLSVAVFGTDATALVMETRRALRLAA